MATKEQANSESTQVVSKESAKSLAVGKRGIKTGNDFAQFMSALMTDLIEGKVTPNVGNAACNAGGKLLKVVDMQQKYGTNGQGQSKTLMLATDEK
jgi:hypothetical protein